MSLVLAHRARSEGARCTRAVRDTLAALSIYKSPSFRDGEIFKKSFRNG